MAKLVTANGSTQEVTVEHLFQRRGREFASVRFADSHFEIVEAKNLNPEPPRPLTDAEIQAANRALDALARELQPPPKSKENIVIAAKDSFGARQLRLEAEARTLLIWVVLLFFTIAVLYLGLDSVGWIPHHEDTTITAEASWFVGESKECVSIPLDAKTAAAEGKDAGYAVTMLHCDSGPPRDVRVTFFGRVAQPEYDAVNWKCTREQDGFTCYELSGDLPTREP